MVYDSIDNLIKYAPAFMPKAAEIVEFLTLAQTRSYEEFKNMQEQFPFRLCFNEYQTLPAESVPFEAHRKFWDLQVVFEGEEMLGWAPLAELSETVPYDEAEDIAYYSGEGQRVRLKKGVAVLLAPWDGHQPCLSVGDALPVKKIVLKLSW